MAATGQAVWVAATLEHALRREVARLVEEQSNTHSHNRQRPGKERAPAGALLHDLRDLGASAELCERIRVVLDRRNRLVHRMLEEHLPAIQDGSDHALEEATEEITRFSYDCAKCTAELAAGWLVAARRLEAAEN